MDDIKRARFTSQFNSCRKIMSALGDENRQLIIKLMLEHCGEGGQRVGEIQEKTMLSRTAVSHHLKVLLETELVLCRKKGTMNFYMLNTHSQALQALIDFWKAAEFMIQECPIQQEG